LFFSLVIFTGVHQRDWFDIVVVDIQFNSSCVDYVFGYKKETTKTNQNLRSVYIMINIKKMLYSKYIVGFLQRNLLLSVKSTFFSTKYMFSPTSLYGISKP